MFFSFFEFHNLCHSELFSQGPESHLFGNIIIKEDLDPSSQFLGVDGNLRPSYRATSYPTGYSKCVFPLDKVT